MHTAFPGIDIDVVDETGKDVPWGTGGLIGDKKTVAINDTHHLQRS